MGVTRRNGGSSDSDSASDRSRSRGRSSSSESKSSGSSRSRSSAKSGSGSPSRSRSPFSSRSSSASSASSGKRSDRSSQSNGSKKSKKLTKVSDRKASTALLSKLSDSGSDSESEENSKQQVRKKKSPSPEPERNKESIAAENNDQFDDGLDDDLIGDEEDRKMLEEMTEKEREEELFRRAERREELKKRFEITKKLKLQNKDKPGPVEDKSEGEVSSDDDQLGDKSTFAREQEGRVKGYEVKHASKFNALNKLKAQREQKEKKEQERKEKEEKKSKRKKDSGSSDNSDMEKLAKHRKKKSKVADIYSSSSDSDHGERRRSSSSSSSSSSNSGSLSSGESDTERHSSKKRVHKVVHIETFMELDKIRLSRYKLDRFCHLPIFKKTVVGCFVRISIGNHPIKGPMYRVAEILDICETAKVYEVIKNRTNIGLKVRHGKDTKVFRMNFVSNSPITESEFKKWQEASKDANLDIPLKSHVEEKLKNIQYALEYKFSNADVDKMLASKEKFAKGPKNLAVHKAKLQRDLITAQNNGDTKEVEDLELKLSELEERAEDLDKKRCGTLSNITFINDRNRRMNIERAEAGIKLEEERMKKEGHIQDPFTRRKTRPTLSLPKTTHNSPEKMTSDILLALEKEKEANAKAEMKEKENIIKKEDNGDLKPAAGMKKEVSDIFNAHDFDIDIDITGSTESAASLSTSLSVRPVVSNSAPRGPVKKSIKLEDYKKRRGII